MSLDIDQSLRLPLDGNLKTKLGFSFNFLFLFFNGLLKALLIKAMGENQPSIYWYLVSS